MEWKGEQDPVYSFVCDTPAGVYLMATSPVHSRSVPAPECTGSLDKCDFNHIRVT